MSWAQIAVATTAPVGNGQQRQHVRFVESESRPATDDGYQTVSDDDEYSDEEEEEDSDYEPIDIAAWGDNAKKEPEQPASWGALLDPNFKVKAGELGSGSLHRRGGNFKPISEEHIIAQRKGQSIPGGLGGGKKKSRGGKKKKKAAIGVTSSSPIRPTVVSARKPIFPVASHRPPERKPPANAPPSPWASQPLVEAPFWEKKAPAVAAPAPAPAAISKWSTVAASNTPAAASTRNAPASASNWNTSAVASSWNTPAVAPNGNAPSFIKVSSDEDQIASSTTPPASTTCIVTSRIIATSTSTHTSTTTTTTSTTSTSASATVATTATNNIPKFNPNAEGFTPSSSTTTTTKNWNIPAASFEPTSASTSTPTTPTVAEATLSPSPSPTLQFNPNAPTFNSYNPNAPSWSQTITPTNWGIAIVQYNPAAPAFTPPLSFTTTNTSPTSLSTSTNTTTISSSTTGTAAASRHAFNTNVPEFLPFVQIPEKKPVKISTSPPEAPKEKSTATTVNGTATATTTTTKKPSMFANNPLVKRQFQQINQGISSNNKPAAATAATATESTAANTAPAITSAPAVAPLADDMQQLNMNSQTGPESTRGLEEPKPLIQFNMELAPGISTEILVYENSDPNQLVEDFASYHRLNITNTAKAKLAATFAQIIQEKKAAIASSLI